MSESWAGRIKAFGSQTMSWASRVTAKVLPDSAGSAPPFASFLFIVSSAIFLFQATKRIPRRSREPVPHRIIGPVEHLHNRPEARTTFFDRLTGRLRLRTTQDAVLQEVLFSWLLAESFSLWLWMVSGVDSLLNSYWIKMAELYPPSGGHPSSEGQQFSLSSMLPLVLGVRDSWTSLTTPEVLSPEPDISQLNPVLRTLLRPSFLRPFILCVLAVSPLLLLKLLPRGAVRRNVDDENDNGMMFWVPLIPRVRWEETEFGSSGYFLDREPPRITDHSSEERNLVPWRSEIRVRHPDQPEHGMRRSRSRSRSTRPQGAEVSRENQLKSSKST